MINRPMLIAGKGSEDKVTAEKLPIPHTANCLTSVAGAKKFSNEMSAEQRYEIIMPTINNDRPDFIKPEKTLSNATTIAAPRIAPTMGKAVPPSPATTGNDSNATPNEAPLETPRMDGPAKGLRKVVCIIRPAADKAEPARMAVRASGRRD